MNIYSLSFTQLVDFVTKIQYGYIDVENNEHLKTFSNPDKNYLLQYPNQLVKSKIGTCFDIVSRLSYKKGNRMRIILFGVQGYFFPRNSRFYHSKKKKQFMV